VVGIELDEVDDGSVVGVWADGVPLFELQPARTSTKTPAATTAADFGRNLIRHTPFLTITPLTAPERRVTLQLFYRVIRPQRYTFGLTPER
jgi:hypothetical protein